MPPQYLYDQLFIFAEVDDTSDSYPEIVITSRSMAEFNQADSVVYQTFTKHTCFIYFWWWTTALVIYFLFSIFLQTVSVEITEGFYIYIYV